MSKVQRRWTPKEDSLLSEGVKLQSATREGKTINWNEVAKKIPGRSNKDCRKRYHNEVTGGLKKGPWTEEEDSKLKHHVSECDMSWAAIAQKIGNRSADQCSKRWQHCLDPSLDRRPWTDDENHLLLVAVSTHGTTWKDIQTLHFSARSANNVKNQYMIITRKSVEISSAAPPCCPDLTRFDTDDQSDDSMSIDADIADDGALDSFCSQIFANDFANSNGLDSYPFVGNFSLADVGIAQPDLDGGVFRGSGTHQPAEIAPTPDIDLSRACAANAAPDPFSAPNIDSSLFADFPSTTQAQLAPATTNNLPLSPHQNLDHYTSQNLGTMASQKPPEPSRVPIANSQVTIMIDDPDPGTVMDVMQVLVQSKAKVRLEAT